ncbi:hypothetical protein HRR90_007168 [Exophiala dermatitidis]|uniref:Uncharacterized protein n=1 Tax=Exophiala dermatitidis TaxID=5970 RepID=A0AAN6ERC6_EXODE|nr:hypothetical protein HRR77_007865 [Exophiala dermatitidis]KAJ4553231.1 hypothetical protein HRR79_009753 [Exophiala dermatitidis]KAJ4565837.1 hypothetical protein HRR82_008831 [Exophiala dermatitidis]KAJ4602293.1 hypothetical protein HRR84_002050 [Exophiala dermatitidis]KAJ4615219.1 hypothetical protein HRR86_008165 [Exophiala dermatitidis]
MLDLKAAISEAQGQSTNVRMGQCPTGAGGTYAMFEDDCTSPCWTAGPSHDSQSRWPKSTSITRRARDVCDAWSMNDTVSSNTSLGPIRAGSPSTALDARPRTVLDLRADFGDAESFDAVDQSGRRSPCQKKAQASGEVPFDDIRAFMGAPPSW